MGLLNDMDFLKTLALPNGEVLIRDPTYIPPRIGRPPSSQHTASQQSQSQRQFSLTTIQFETTKWKNEIGKLYRKIMKKNPLWPCINCGIAAADRRKVFSKSGRNFVMDQQLDKDFNESVWSLLPYYTWYKKEKAQPSETDITLGEDLKKSADEDEATLKDLKPFLSVCGTCWKQLVSKSPFLRMKRNLIVNHLAIPTPSVIMSSLSAIERRTISLIQPFARLYHSGFCGVDGMHGPVTFVPLEIERFKDGIYNQIVTVQRHQLSRIYRHPQSLDNMPFRSDLVSSSRIRDALAILTAHHPSYQSLLFEEFSSTPLSIQEMTATEEINVGRCLRESKNYAEFLSIFKSLWDKRDQAGEESVLLLDIRDEQHSYNSSFLINWRAKNPMGKLFYIFIDDSLSIILYYCVSLLITPLLLLCFLNQCAIWRIKFL